MRDTLKIQIDGEDATIGCLLNTALFENGAELASCQVVHPMDRHLTVSVTASDPRQCLISSCHDINEQLESMLRTVDAHLIQQQDPDQRMN